MRTQIETGKISNSDVMKGRGVSLCLPCSLVPSFHSHLICYELMRKAAVHQRAYSVLQDDTFYKFLSVLSFFCASVSESNGIRYVQTKSDELGEKTQFTTCCTFPRSCERSRAQILAVPSLLSGAPGRRSTGAPSGPEAAQCG